MSPSSARNQWIRMQQHITLRPNFWKQQSTTRKAECVFCQEISTDIAMDGCTSKHWKEIEASKIQTIFNKQT